MSDIEKIAQSIELGDPVVVGQEMASIIGFILRSVPENERGAAVENLHNKLLLLNPSEIASKQSPTSASVGQAITFVKTILNGLPYGYVKTVIESTVRSLHK